MIQPHSLEGSVDHHKAVTKVEPVKREKARKHLKKQTSGGHKSDGNILGRTNTCPGQKPL